MESPANQTSTTEGCVKFSPDFEVLENFEVYEERGGRREEEVVKTEKGRPPAVYLFISLSALFFGRK